MKTILLILSSAFAVNSFSQNVGIGTNTPGFPLSFSNSIGSKISLYGQTGNHYGFGIQGGLFQMYADAAAANIAFGYGSSTSFTERMKLYNNGPDVLLAQGRITLRNGTTPLDQAYGPGVWLSRADNTANLGFMGTQNNQNIGFYGGPAGWGFTYDAINSRVGIGNPNPNAALAFPAALGRKITFYPGTIGNAGIGVYSNELRIHSDNPNADITLGAENTGGTFAERMRVKGNGAVAFNGNTGASGQILQSNGSNAAPTWATIAIPPKTSAVYFNQSGNTAIGGTLETVISGLSGSFSLSQPSTVIIQGLLNIVSTNATFNSFGYTEVQILDAVNNIIFTARSTATMSALRKSSMSPVGAISLPGGIYSARAIIGRLNVADLPGTSFCEAPSQLIVQIIPN